MSSYKELYKDLFIAVELYKEAYEDVDECWKMQETFIEKEQLLIKTNKLTEAKEYMYSLLD